MHVYLTIAALLILAYVLFGLVDDTDMPTKTITPRKIAFAIIAILVWPLSLAIGLVAALIYFTVAVLKNNWKWPSKYLSK